MLIDFRASKAFVERCVLLTNSATGDTIAEVGGSPTQRTFFAKACNSLLRLPVAKATRNMVFSVNSYPITDSIDSNFFYL